MESLLVELATFLSNPKPEVRLEAVQNVLGFTQSADALSFFRSPDSRVIKDLKTLCLDSMPIAHDAFKALINITADLKAVDDRFAEEEFIANLVRLTIHEQFKLADLACMLLSNITKSAAVCRILAQLNDDVLRGLFLLQLIEAFSRGRTHNPEADFHFLASVFANVSLYHECRQILVDKARGLPLSKIVCFTEHPNLVRRGGVISTIKNCCFLIDQHPVLLAENGVNLLPRLLLPLAGPEEFSEEDMDGMFDELQFLEPEKTREPDAFLRAQLLESLTLLTTTRYGRDFMREKKAYPIIREMHSAETDESCDDITRRLVDMLMGDESSNISEVVEAEGNNSVISAEELRAVSSILKEKIDKIESEEWGEIHTI